MILSRSRPLDIGTRRIVKQFAFYDTIRIGRVDSSDIERVTLIFHSYYVLEELINNRFGNDWNPIEYALTENVFKSSPYKNHFERCRNQAKMAL